MFGLTPFGTLHTAIGLVALVLQPIFATLLFLFLVGITLQFRWLRKQPALQPVPATSR